MSSKTSNSNEKKPTDAAILHYSEMCRAKFQSGSTLHEAPIFIIPCLKKIDFFIALCRLSSLSI